MQFMGMETKGLMKSAADRLRQVDWKLLLFLVLFLNVKLAVKVSAIILIYLLRFNFRFGFRLRLSRLPLFYPSVIAIALVNWVAYRLFFQSHYNLVLATGLFFWLLCILAIHQVKLSVDTLPAQTMLSTLVVFFLLNAVFSAANMIAIVIETKALNPYLYQGSFQKYFIGTGDYIRGIFFDTSTTNAIINAFGVIYFLNKRMPLMVFICMAVLLMTGSNLTNILIASALAGIFIFQSDRNQKSIIAICLFMMVIFFARISPQNNQYAVATLENTFVKKDISGDNLPAATAGVTVKQESVMTEEDKKQKFAQAVLDSINQPAIPPADVVSITATVHPQPVIASVVKKINKETRKPRETVVTTQAVSKPSTTIAVQVIPAMAPPANAVSPDPWVRPVIPGPDINSFEYQSSVDTTAAQRRLLAFMEAGKEDQALLKLKEGWQKKPGKAVALQQTYYFMKAHPSRLLTGNGMGTFSSKLALKTTALNIAGGYPAKYAYINPAYSDNHLALYLHYLTKRTGFHSVMNTPDSMYDQLLGEYGLAGLCSFLFLYVFFFAKKMKTLSYAIPMSLIMGLVFCLGYWFEQLSVVVVFELFMLTAIKEVETGRVIKSAQI